MRPVICCSVVSRSQPFQRGCDSGSPRPASSPSELREVLVERGAKCRMSAAGRLFSAAFRSRRSPPARVAHPFAETVREVWSNCNRCWPDAELEASLDRGRSTSSAICSDRVDRGLDPIDPVPQLRSNRNARPDEVSGECRIDQKIKLLRLRQGRLMLPPGRPGRTAGQSS